VLTIAIGRSSATLQIYGWHNCDRHQIASENDFTDGVVAAFEKPLEKTANERNSHQISCCSSVVCGRGAQFTRFPFLPSLLVVGDIGRQEI
jgi:hypothetical protein